MRKIQMTGRLGGVRSFGALPIALLAMLSFSALALSDAGVDASESKTGKVRRKKREDKSNRTPATINEKLSWLLSLDMTSAEIALATGSSVRGIEERRRKLKDLPTSNSGGNSRNVRIDSKIDDLFSIAFLLAQRYVIPSENIRGWFIGRTAYLGEQRPANLLREGQFELVRDAAIAYATGTSPEEFLSRQAPVPRVGDPVTA